MSESEKRSVDGTTEKGKVGLVRVDEAPRDERELHEWVRRFTGIEVVRESVVKGVGMGEGEGKESGAFGYLVQTFFEGSRSSRSSARDALGAGLGGKEDCADVVAWACRGGGKTMAGAIATLLDLVFKRGVQVRVLAGSREQGEKMYGYLRGFFERAWFAGLVKGRVRKRGLELVNGSGVEVLAASEASVRGVRVQKMRCDEVDVFDEDVWRAAQLCVKSVDVAGVWGPRVRGAVEALSTLHTVDGVMWGLVGAGRERADSSGEEGKGGGAGTRVVFRWGVREVLEACPAWRQCAACPIEAECGGTAKERARLAVLGGRGRGVAGAVGHVKIEDVIRAKGRVSEEVWGCEMLCRTPRAEGRVWEEFAAGVHVFDSTAWDVPAGKEPAVEGLEKEPEAARGFGWIGGMDFGFGGLGVSLIAATGEDGVVRVVDEIAGSETKLGEFVEQMKARGWWRADWLGIDPAGRQREMQSGRSAASVLRDAGWRVRMRETGVEEGIEAVRARLRSADGTVRLLIHARCTGLIRAMRGYRYAKGGRREVVKDGHDHSADALRYMIVNLERGQARTRRYV